MQLTQILEYLGVQFNTIQGHVFLPHSKIQEIQSKMKIVSKLFLIVREYPGPDGGEGGFNIISSTSGIATH